MRVINCERIVPCDIDGTLITHEKAQPQFVYGPYNFGDSYLVERVTKVENRLLIIDPYTGETCDVGINQNMVRLFREELARGSHMLVWSRGGYRWAKAVIEALELDNEAESDQITIASKPFVYFDDLEVSSWMSERVFIPPGAYYKKGG